MLPIHARALYCQHYTTCLGLYPPQPTTSTEADTHAVSVGGVRIYDVLCLGKSQRHGEEFDHRTGKVMHQTWGIYPLVI